MYVSETSVISAIQYFKNKEYRKPMHLSLFFYFKSLNISESNSLLFKRNPDQVPKEKALFNLYLFGGLFDKEFELGEKNSCLFPFSFNKVGFQKDSFYNGGTKFNSLYTRIPDTIDNTLSDSYLTVDKQGYSSLSYRYLDILSEYLEDDNKISLVAFSTWLCRFINFDISNDISELEFTKLCVNYTKDFFNLSEKELKLFFIEDYYYNFIESSTSKISGETIRSQFDYLDKGTPDINPIQTSAQNIIIINENETRNYIMRNAANPSSEEIINILSLSKQLIFYGVPGVGKSKIVNDLIDYKKEGVPFFKESKVTQFNANTSYEDFIGGETIINGDINTVAGEFLEYCVLASEDPENNYLYVIDEINRGNIARIFGETVMALDREYTVKLPKIFVINDKEITELKIPNNIYILGTMNFSDRSITNFDFALRRRFAFVPLSPDENLILENINHADISDIGKMFKEINARILEHLKDDSLLLGHSYFLNRFSQSKYEWSSTDFRINFNYYILPTLKEYALNNSVLLTKLIGEKLQIISYSNDSFNKNIIEEFHLGYANDN